MASLRTRKNRDGTTSYAVLWRDGTKQRSRTFEDDGIAKRFQLDLELDGEQAALERLAALNPATLDAAPPVPTLDAWIANYINHLTDVHEGTRTEYRGLYKNHWGRALGHLPLDAITRDRVRAAQNALSKRGLAPKTIANSRGLLSAALDEALIDGLIERNPCRGVKLPRGSATDDEVEEMVCLDYDEFSRLYAQIPEHRRTLVLTLVGTGARWGEVTALRVGDVDLKTATIRITRAWKRLPGGIKIGSPKTRRSRRTVKLPPELVDALRPLVAGRPREELLFTNGGGRRDNRPITIGTFRKRVWNPAVTAAKLQRRPRIHDLRHTHASWLIAKGVGLTVIQRRLGHESIKTTSDTYGHLLPDVIEQSATAAGEVFSHLESGAKELPPSEWEPGDVESEIIDGEEIDEDE